MCRYQVWWSCCNGRCEAHSISCLSLGNLSGSEFIWCAIPSPQLPSSPPPPPAPWMSWPFWKQHLLLQLTNDFTVNPRCINWCKCTIWPQPLCIVCYSSNTNLMPLMNNYSNLQLSGEALSQTHAEIELSGGIFLPTEAEWEGFSWVRFLFWQTTRMPLSTLK